MITSPQDLTEVEARQFVRGPVTHKAGWLHEADGITTIVAIYDHESAHYGFTTRRFAIAVDGRVTGGGVVATIPAEEE